MWWAKAGDWSAKAVDQFLGQDAAHKANRTNIMLARENRDWMEMMSNTAMQRHMKDLEAAGINPMYGLGTGAGASTPVGQSARVEPTYRPGNMDLKITDTLLAAANAKQLAATTRLTNAEAALKEAQVPHGAASAQASLDKVQEEIVRLGQQIELGSLEISKARELQPLLIDAQRLMNKALDLGLSRKELESNVAEMFGIPFQYGSEVVRRLGDLGSAGGVAVGDFIQWLKDLPKRGKDAVDEFKHKDWR